MTDPKIPVTEDELHAYVDNELPGERRGDVEAWLATHPEDAERVQAWRTMAGALHARYDAVANEPVPRRLDLERLMQPARKWLYGAIAASVLSFVAGSGAGWIAHGAAAKPSLLQSFTLEALDAHRLYVVEVRHPVEVAGANRPTWCSGSRSGLAMTCARLSWRNWAQARWRTPAARRERRRRRARHVRRPVGRALHHLLRAV